MTEMKFCVIAPDMTSVVCCHSIFCSLIKLEGNIFRGCFVIKSFLHSILHVPTLECLIAYCECGQ